MNYLKKVAAIAFLFILLLLDYAALDDITTGNENSYALEYAVVLFSVIVFGFLGLRIINRKRKT